MSGSMGAAPAGGTPPRTFRPETVDRLEALAARYPERDAVLLPALRLAEEEFGCIDDAAMRCVAHHVGVSPAKVFGVFTFYTHYRRATDGEYVLQVCSTLSCALRGSERIFDFLSKRLGIRKDETTPDGKFTLKKVECLANCDQAPCVQINEDFADCVTEEQLEAWLRQMQEAPLGGHVRGFGPWHPPAQVYHLPPNPRYAHAQVMLKHVLEPGAGTYAHYTGHGGWSTGLEVIRGARGTPDEVIEAVFQSGLRGRGGAGFPTGQKWKFLAKNNKPRYLVVNADESEPGTFKDKVILDRDPHALLEGILIAAWAIRSNHAYIYIRGEFCEGAKILNRAIEEAYTHGTLGKNIRGSGFDLDVTVHRGAGAYICGEETGLLSSLEGGRGHPKIKPPFPAVEGAWRSPTIVNNVETLAILPAILENGPAWYRTFGTEKSAGTKLFSISGHVVRPGVYEVPLGISLKEFIFDVCGGIPNGKKLKAVCPGGSSSPFLTSEEVLRESNPITMDYESMAANGTMLGSGAIIVMDEDTCMVEATWNVLRFYAHESCGQCTPCREGTGWISKLAGRFERGGANEADIDLLDEVAWSMVGRTICVLADAAAMPARSLVRKFRADFEAHARHGGCPHRHGHAPKIPVRAGAQHA